MQFEWWEILFFITEALGIGYCIGLYFGEKWTLRQRDKKGRFIKR